MHTGKYYFYNYGYNMQKICAPAKNTFAQIISLIRLFYNSFLIISSNDSRLITSLALPPDIITMAGLGSLL